jgi:hypothetical protein
MPEIPTDRWASERLRWQSSRWRLWRKVISLYLSVCVFCVRSKVLQAACMTTSAAASIATQSTLIGASPFSPCLLSLLVLTGSTMRRRTAFREDVVRPSAAGHVVHRGFPDHETALFRGNFARHTRCTNLFLSFSLFIVSVSADALQYVRTNLTDAVGGFYSAEDADSYPYEGAPHKEEGIGVSVHSVPVCLSLSLCVHYL